MLTDTPSGIPGTESQTSLAGRVMAVIRDRGLPAWLVGGYVRDRLLGRDSADLDVVVPEGGIPLARAIAASLDGSFFVLDAGRDVGRAIIRQMGGLLDVDVAQFRASSLAADLALRDFTVNAIAVDLTADVTDGCVIDPFDGRADLARGAIRAISEGAFHDDPLRMLRAVRQAAELGFHIEEATTILIRRDAPLVGSVSAERIRDELMRLIPAPGGWRQVALLNQLGLLAPTLPEAAATVGVTQSPPHHQDVFDHTLSVMAHLEGLCALLWPGAEYRRPGFGRQSQPGAQWNAVADVLVPYAKELREHLSQPLAAGRARRDLLFWAALAHDWGKPAKRSIDGDGRIRFLGHDHWGALLIEHRARDLKLASDEVAYLACLVDQHMRPGYLAHDFPPGRRALYRYYRDTGAVGPDCILLSLADHLATYARQAEPEGRQQRLQTTEMLLRAYFRERATQVDPPPLLDGHGLMAQLGLQPGPQVGKLLAELREAQAVGEVSTSEQAKDWLAERVRAEDAKGWAGA